MKTASASDPNSFLTTLTYCSGSLALIFFCTVKKSLFFFKFELFLLLLGSNFSYFAWKYVNINITNYSSEIEEDARDSIPFTITN